MASLAKDRNVKLAVNQNGRWAAFQLHAKGD